MDGESSSRGVFALSRRSNVNAVLRRMLSMCLAALVFDAVAPSHALAHFGFNDGHPTAGLGILVFGGAIALIGFLAYLAFFKNNNSEDTESD